MKFEVQTRNEKGQLTFFATLKEAFDHAEADQTVWKISFSLPTSERVRMVKLNRRWVYEDIMSEIEVLKH